MFILMSFWFNNNGVVFFQNYDIFLSFSGLNAYFVFNFLFMSSFFSVEWPIKKAQNKDHNYIFAKGWCAVLTYTALFITQWFFFLLFFHIPESFYVYCLWNIMALKYDWKQYKFPFFVWILYLSTYVHVRQNVCRCM